MQRALQPDGGGVVAADGGIGAVLGVEADHRDRRRRGVVGDRHVDARAIGPQAQQRPAAIAQQGGDVEPGVGVHGHARPGGVGGGGAVEVEQVGERRHGGFAFGMGRVPYPSSAATCWNQATSAGGRKMPPSSTSARWAKIGKVEACTRRLRPLRGAERHRGELHQQRAERDQQADHHRHRQHGLAGEGGADQQEFAHEHAEGRQPGDGDDAGHQGPAQHRVGLREPAHVGQLLRALGLGDVADGEENRRFGQAVHGHLQQPGEIAERARHAEGEHDDAHVLDRRIGEQALDVDAPVQHQGGEEQRQQAEPDHQRPRRQRLRVGGQQHLEAQQRIQRHVQQQARQHRRDRRRALGMRIRQPGVQRRQAHLGAVAQQQEHEGDVQQLGVEAGGLGDQHGPHHRAGALAHHRAGRRGRPGWCRTAPARCRRCRG